MEQAKKNFQEELEIDPRNAVAEFVLGQLAADANDFAAAIQHFRRATKLDIAFTEAYLGLGTRLQFCEAVCRRDSRRLRLTRRWRPTAQQGTINWRSLTPAPDASRIRTARRNCNVNPPKRWNQSSARRRLRKRSSSSRLANAGAEITMEWRSAFGRRQFLKNFRLASLILPALPQFAFTGGCAAVSFL